MDVNDYLRLGRAALVKLTGRLYIGFDFKDPGPNYDGIFFRYSDGFPAVWIRPGLTPMRVLRTLLHEAAHAKLHDHLVNPAVTKGSVVFDLMAEEEANLLALQWEAGARLAVKNYADKRGLRLSEAEAVRLMLIYLGGHEND